MSYSLVVDCETGKTKKIAISDDEMAAREAAQSELLKEVAERQSARLALLKRLGITEDEARLLLS